jgi:hypothetical protein
VKKIIYLSILIVLGLSLILSQFLIRVRISCSTQFGECPREITDSLVGINGKSIFQAKREIKKTLSSNFLTTKYTVQFKLPNTLKIDLSMRRPRFALKGVSPDTVALVDGDGMVLTINGSSSLPTVITEGELPKIGEKVSSTSLMALTLIEGLNKMYQITTGVVQNDTLLVDLPAQVRVIFPLVDADSELLLGSLRLIYSSVQDAENKTLYNEIDMRYKNPVLR